MSREKRKVRAYKTLVRLGREAVETINRGEDAKWTLGDLACEVVPSGGKGSGGRNKPDPLGDYARDIGMNRGTLQAYRQTAQKWPEEQRELTASWSVHYVLAGHPDRFDLIQPSMLHKEALEASERAPRVSEQNAVNGRGSGAPDALRVSPKMKVIRRYLKEELEAGVGVSEYTLRKVVEFVIDERFGRSKQRELCEALLLHEARRVQRRVEGNEAIDDE